ncbi:SDR family oxidoreductase [Paenibacillus sp. JCM 10914]|uniref:SDR family NAD(P)-dependent oxidoreductase n=1 Tax=Paenibacillus sp. JCM 10914 TaxID=1236974 RepID=UPI0003CC58D2|nr:SDR family NAD(P)-dependent oxidoreductase [Paenibacillus sp. JCM 10914]GAE06571.1 oxidoreductase, short-chain dehydrogenase/reductase family [Paenibacillus sp. JCM 10914]
MCENRKFTLITGASSGIGYATAKAFANRGKNLIIVARREKRLDDLKLEILATHPNLKIVIMVCDLSISSNVYRLYNDLKNYCIETFINNAGFGNYSSIARQDLSKIEKMLRLNIEALTILTSLYVRDYHDMVGAQLINISSRGGYIIVPNAVTYCAAKFYVSAFTEGLAHELKASQAQLQVKVFAPAATQTEFGMIANDVSEYNYDNSFGYYHTDAQVANFLLQLYDSDQTVGTISGETFEFSLRSPVFEYAGDSLT